LFPEGGRGGGVNNMTRVGTCAALCFIVGSLAIFFGHAAAEAPSDPPKSFGQLLPLSTDQDVGSCQNGTLLLPDQHAPPDPWLRWLCIKASSSSSSSFPADGKLWAQYTKVYRRLRPKFFPGKDIPKGGLVVSAKLFASGEFLSSRYFVLRECDDSKDFRGCLKQSLDFLRDVATEMDAPPKVTEKW
jgi:hypothetical protein